MHFWKNNNSKIQDKVTSLKDAVDFPYCEEIKLIVSFDISNLGSRFFSTIQQSQAEETSFNSQLLQQSPSAGFRNVGALCECDCGGPGI